MKKSFIALLIVFVCLFTSVFAQIPVNTLVQIVKAEDELRFDATLVNLMKSKDAKIRTRAALAVGRIGNDAAMPELIALLEKDSSAEVRTMAAFAIGEIESIKGADVILKAMTDAKTPDRIRARAVESAGKIAAANTKDEKSKTLGAAILEVLETENKRGNLQNREVVLLAITAALRVRPEKTDVTVAKFLTNADARIRTDAGNTLARVRAKNANEHFRKMLVTDENAEARANAARALGAAEDKEALDILLKAATEDEDSRVRVSAIRAVGSLKDAKSADKLIERGEELLKFYKKEFYDIAPAEKNELLEIAATLGRILLNSDNEKALRFLNNFGAKDSYNSSEIHIAIAAISPSNFLKIETPEFICSVNYARITPSCWQFNSGRAKGLSELAKLDESNSARINAVDILREQLKSYSKNEFASDRINELAIPDTLTAYASFKTKDLPEVLRSFLKYNDVFTRAAAVGILGDLPPEQIRFGDFEDSFRIALEDKKYDDALLATIEAIGKQSNERATDFLKDRLLFLSKLNPKYGKSNFLSRRRIVALLKEKEGGDFFDKIGSTNSIFTRKDYLRAVSRKNGTVKAVFTTEKGNFTIDLAPEDAPLTVDNFIKLAKLNYFNGLLVHRVVPNFVMQDGDPRGDGNGGPGWSIRCELNMLPFERGAVGMALSGKDTGGSQWFATHSPQPHLDGGYTVFGRVNETDMKVVDKIVRGDKILSVKIVEGKLPVKSSRK